MGKRVQEGLLLAALLSIIIISEAIGAAPCLYLQRIVVERKTTAAEILAALKLGEDFDYIARSRSIGAAARDGGYLGRVCLDDLVASLKRALIGMKVGDLTAVIEFKGRYLIFKRISKEEALRKEARILVETQGGRAPEDYIRLGLSLGKQGFTEKEIWAYRKAIELDPSSAEAHMLLGETLRRLGRYDEAVKELKKATELSPETAEAHNNLGLAYVNQGMLLLALHEFKRAVELKPSYGEAHNNLAVCYLLLQRFELARRHALEAKALNYPVERLMEELKRRSGKERR